MTPVHNLDETAEALRVSRRTVERLIASGQIRPVRIGRRVVVTVKELDAYLARAVARRPLAGRG
jgi:excisionase family DNA binding protein